MARTVLLSLEEGQAVWFHSQARYIESEYVRVVTLDQRNATLANGFIANRYTGVCAGRGFDRPPGFIYLTEEDWQVERTLYDSWKRLKREISEINDLPEGMTRRQLLAVRRILRIGE